MKTSKKVGSKDLQKFFKDNKIATLNDLKRYLNSSSTMTVFRKLKSMGYLSSYSHRGRYYTLRAIPRFDEFGLWFFRSVRFSKYGNLIETAKTFIDSSNAGFTAHELEGLLHVETKHVLLQLFKKQRIHREKIAGYYVYFSLEAQERKRQVALRNAGSREFEVNLSCQIEHLSDELKAAIILFFSLLDEKQRRLYAGLEAYKLGHGGDTQIARLLGLDVHTVAKGRKDLFGQEVVTDRIRREGGGRKPVEKKRRRSSGKSSDF
jgi:hypothetical protein